MQPPKRPTHALANPWSYHTPRQPICDTSDNYQLMSYSREFCERSHDRYTLCG